MKIPGTHKIDCAPLTCVRHGDEVYCFHIDYSKGKKSLDQFVRELDECLPEFVFSPETLSEYEEDYRLERSKITPIENARDCLKKTTIENLCTSGEVGELLLYLFAKKIIGATKIISKMQTRADDRMSILGRDTEFIEESGGDLFFLLGESKLEPSINDGLREAQSDMNKFWKSGKIKNEVRLAASSLKQHLTAENYAAYRKYFLKDTEERKKLKYKNVIFVGYSCNDFKGLIDNSADLDSFLTATLAKIETSLKTQKEVIAKAGEKTNLFCFIPFECVYALRERFARHNKLIL